MKKTFAILPATLALLSFVPSAGKFSPVRPLNQGEKASSSLTPGQVLASLRNGFAAEGTYTETLDYPDAYNVLDSKTTYSFRQDFGHIQDGEKSRKATRVYDGNTSTLYFEGDDNYAYYDVLLPDNTVGTINYDFYGMNIVYGDDFKNPFDYIGLDDIADDLTLDNTKASFVLSTILGISRAVGKAQIEVSGDQVTGIAFDVLDKPLGISDGTGFETILSSISVTLNIDTSVSEFSRLAPSTAENPTLASALSAFGDNYTACFSSNGLAKESALYVTTNGIYYQADRYSRGPENDDLLYIPTGGIYTLYAYENGKMVNKGLSSNSPIATYVGGIESISPALFDDKGENTYALAADACAYGAPSLAPSTYGLSEDGGLSAYMTLEDGKVKTVSTTIQSYSILTFVTEFDNYGTTGLPTWVDLANL